MNLCLIKNVNEDLIICYIRNLIIIMFFVEIYKSMKIRIIRVHIILLNFNIIKIILKEIDVKFL